MIDVKQAAANAIKYFSGIYKGKYRDLELEEVELSEDERYWMITLGFSPFHQDLARRLAEENGRKYKLFKVDAANGEVLSMKIRKI